MSTNVNDTPTITSGAVSEVPRVIALDQPAERDGRDRREAFPAPITRTHQPMA